MSEATSDHFLRVFHVEKINFDDKFEKLSKNCINIVLEVVWFGFIPEIYRRYKNVFFNAEILVLGISDFPNALALREIDIF